MKLKIGQSRIEADFEYFVRTLPALEPVEFCGLAKLLSVSMIRREKLANLTKEDVEKMGLDEKTEYVAELMIPMEEVIEAMVNRYLGLNKKRRKEINQILKDIKKSRKSEVTKNGATT